MVGVPSRGSPASARARGTVDGRPASSARAPRTGPRALARAETARAEWGRHRAAIQSGDRVAIMLQNTPHFVIALLGAWKAGATVV
ncbi:AMP-binding protein, partial [Streptomyces sp. NPDC005877]|uniref:AMP-binding protein n=1 Tax=Streptomyces sp. NPDC005877 TaxID=3155346 RepID=UPI0033E51142